MQEINRREFVKLAGHLSAGTGLLACNQIPSFIFDQSEPLSSISSTSPPQFTQTVHLLNRLTFGPRPGDIERVEMMGYEEFIETQLNPESLASDRAEAALDEFQWLANHSGKADQATDDQPVLELNSATLARALYSEQQLYEIMVDFWSNHFNIFQGKGLVQSLKIADDREVIRPYALGNFRDLLGASAHSPAMLYYLDNFRSYRDGPNENYARKLLELHTLGLTRYTEHDVEAIARAFTGWSIANHQAKDEAVCFQFKAHLHDYQAKTILGQSFAAGRGEVEGEEVLDMLAAHPGTARHICRKLCVRFVSDSPPESIIQAAATTFCRTNGDIRAVLRTIFNSNEFWNSGGQKVKRPFEYLISGLRALGAEVVNFKPLVRALEMLGQPLFRWPAPNGYPDVGPPWININGLLARWKLAFTLIGSNNHQKLLGFDLQVPLKAIDNSLTPAEILDIYARHILYRDLPDEDRQLFLDLLEDGLEVNLPKVVALLIASPYFQFR